MPLKGEFISDPSQEKGWGGVEEGDHSGPHGKARGLFRRQKDHKESMAQSLIVFPAGKARQEKVS